MSKPIDHNMVTHISKDLVKSKGIAFSLNPCNIYKMIFFKKIKSFYR